MLVLTHWQPDCPIVVETDASDYALAKILSLQEPNGELHLVTFLSWTFTSAELNYDVHDKELLAIYEAFKVWYYYLEGSTFPIDVVTDHKILEYFLTTKMLSRQKACWSEYLCAFNLVIRFWPNLMCLLVIWTTILKRGENIMVMLAHIIVDLFSHPNNYWPHSELLPYFLQSFMDLFHWMWKSLTKIFFLL